MRILQVTAIVGLGAAADLATKSWAFAQLSGGPAITLAGGLLRRPLVVNHRAAFGRGPAPGPGGPVPPWPPRAGPAMSPIA